MVDNSKSTKVLAPEQFNPLNSVVATFGIVVLYGILQSFVFFCFGVFTTPSYLESFELSEELLSNPNFLSFSTIFCSTICFIMLLRLLRIRNISNLIAYFDIKPISVYRGLSAVIVVVLFGGLIDFLSSALGKSLIPAEVLVAFSRSNSLQFFLSVVIFAPIYEEFLFRGFLFKGIMKSKFGVLGAIIFSSVIWTLTHLYYDIYGIVIILIPISVLKATLH